MGRQVNRFGRETSSPFNLDRPFVLVGVFLAVTMKLCGVKALSFAVGAAAGTTGSAC